MNKDDSEITTKEVHNIVQKRVSKYQNGIGTFFDNIILEQAKAVTEEQNNDHPFLQRAVGSMTTSGRERFVSINERIKNIGKSDLDFYSRIYSQGVLDCFKWKGKPLFKSVHDSAIFQMLIYEVKPATIIEIGSTENSLSYFNDLMHTFSLNTQVIGVDRYLPENHIEGTTFIQGELLEIQKILPIDLVKTFPKPWLVIEDAHSYTLDTLNYLSSILDVDDYLVVEDSIGKQEEILKTFSRFPADEFVVDTYYTDYFGVNATTAVNSIIKRKVKSKCVF